MRPLNQTWIFHMLKGYIPHVEKENRLETSCLVGCLWTWLSSVNPKLSRDSSQWPNYLGYWKMSQTTWSSITLWLSSQLNLHLLPLPLCSIVIGPVIFGLAGNVGASQVGSSGFGCCCKDTLKKQSTQKYSLYYPFHLRFFCPTIQPKTNTGWLCVNSEVTRLPIWLGSPQGFFFLSLFCRVPCCFPSSLHSRRQQQFIFFIFSIWHSSWNKMSSRFCLNKSSWSSRSLKTLNKTRGLWRSGGFGADSLRNTFTGGERQPRQLWGFPLSIRIFIRIQFAFSEWFSAAVARPTPSPTPVGPAVIFLFTSSRKEKTQKPSPSHQQ